MRHYTTPQKAPFNVGDRVQYTGDGRSAGMNAAGKWVESHYPGAMYTVIENHPPYGYFTDEQGSIPCHGWSALQSDDDPEGCHCKGIDVESVSDWQKVEEHQ